MGRKESDTLKSAERAQGRPLPLPHFFFISIFSLKRFWLCCLARMPLTFCAYSDALCTSRETRFLLQGKRGVDSRSNAGSAGTRKRKAVQSSQVKHG